MIRVAMIARSTLYTASGGDTIQIQQTARLLNLHNVQADIRLSHEQIDYSQYNLLHFFNITRPSDILYHIRQTNKPFVVSTILINYGEYDKYNRGGLPGMIFRFLSEDAVEYTKAVARWIKGNDYMVSNAYLWRGQRKSIKEILKKTKLLLPNSFSEYKRLEQQYGCNQPFKVVPNGVDNNLFRYDPAAGKKENLVLCVARIEGIKNQLNVIKALNNTAYQLVIIGDSAPNQQSYYAACRKTAASNVEFIANLPQAELVAYYQKAKAHVLASWFETTGLSSLEAAAMGCNIVISNRGDAGEYFGDDAFYCEPGSPKSILQAVEQACNQSLNTKLLSRITEHYNWQQASWCTAEGYKQTIGTTCH